MEQVKDFNINTVPLWKVVCTATSDPDYEMERTLLVEYPNDSYGEYMIVSGSHCSCFDFNESHWEARICSKDELRLIAKGWQEKGYGSELLIAPLILRYLGND